MNYFEELVANLALLFHPRNSQPCTPSFLPEEEAPRQVDKVLLACLTFFCQIS